MTDFSGRVLLLTGASGGIGRAIAQAFHARGASLLLADLRDDGLQDLARDLEGQGGQVVATRYDAGRPEDASAAVALCLERFGRVDFLVPAAAIYEEHSFLTMSDDDWRRTLSINVASASSRSPDRFGGSSPGVATAAITASTIGSGSPG